MAKDLFGNLSDIGKGLGKVISTGVDKVTEKANELMGKDEYDVQIRNLEREIKELCAKEEECYTEVGKYAVSMNGAESFGDAGAQLMSVQSEIAGRQSDIERLRAAQAVEQAEALSEEEGSTLSVCAECGAELAEGAKFCPECGAKVAPIVFGETAHVCPSCGVELAEGAKFCPECGTKIQ